MDKLKEWFSKEWKFLLALLGLLVFRSLALDWYHVPSESMLPTLLVGDRIVVSKSQYRVRFPFTNVTLFDLSKPAAGDIIVFEYPVDPSTTFVKRIVAVPGDRVSIREGQLFVKPAVKGPTLGDGEFVVEDEKYFVMGDNRMNSADSRVWGFVSSAAILGKVHWVALNIRFEGLTPKSEGRWGLAVH